MRYFLLFLFFSSFVQAQVEPSNYPVFENCSDISGDKLRDCFLDELYNKLYTNLEGKLPEIIENEQVQIFFTVDEEGYFKHRINSAKSEKVGNTIADAFNNLPQVRPARFMDRFISKQFIVILEIPLQKQGSLKEAVNSAVPPPPPPPLMIEELGDEVEIEDVIIEDPSTSLNLEIHEPIEENTGEMEKVPFAIVEKSPVYPGCESQGYIPEQRKCMSEKVSKFVNQEFNTSIAKEVGLTGRQKVIVMFIIDEQGKVAEIKCRSTHPSLEKEAARVINKLPQMKPGMQAGKPVGVIYALPIIFQVQD